MARQTNDEDYRREAFDFAKAVHDEIHINHADEAGVSKDDPDLVIAGIETSQWEGEHFANVLRKIFPTLHIICESSNKILTSMHNVQEKETDFRLELQGAGGIVKSGKKTTYLFVSQHGQTHSTLNTASLLKALNDKYGEKGVFVMTGETDNPIGKAVGQSVALGEEWQGQIFHNGSGRRGAEASTAATAAVDYSFLELDLRLATDFVDVMPTYRLFKQRLNSAGLKKLKERKSGLSMKYLRWSA